MTAPVLGPCEAWIAADDVAACCGVTVDSTNQATLDMFAVSASQILYEMSGRRFSGVCESVVRPCSTMGCGVQALGVGIIPGWGGYGSWGYGYLDIGSPWGWYDTGIGSAGIVCGCQALPTVELGYPVVDIVEVTIDGNVVDPATYRVDEWRYLVRLNDPATGLQLFWPGCQDLAADSGPGTFFVTYTHGIAPPLVGAQAAAALACQLWQSCNGGSECQLPIGATKVIRQGVTIERNLLAAWFNASATAKGWATGIPLVDAFLNAYNPSRLIRRPSVWTPDVVPMPRVTNTAPHS